MRFPDRVRLPLAFDPDRLRADLARVEAGTTWVSHFVRQNYDGDWSAIALSVARRSVLARRVAAGDRTPVPMPIP